MRSLPLLGLLGALVVASNCVVITINDPSTCKTSAITFTSASYVDGGVEDSGISSSEPAITASTQTDMSGVFNKLNGIGTLDFSVAQSSLSVTPPGNFSWLNHIEITIQSVANPTAYPATVLVNQDVNDADSVLNLDTVMDGNALFSYLIQGPVELDFTVVGSAPDVNGLDMTLCANITDHFHKGL